ncbi:CocE/NonD family hydrolase [Sulfolobus tengchongensis]|uniref:CocE/NonD family hydrolase n=1 Tax=Sulfolobus tengchongensis TaxID=207809 RepID=A0AAX4L320_9CREN
MSRVRVFKADEILLALEPYRPYPFKIKEKIDKNKLLSMYFDGYPQLVKTDKLSELTPYNLKIEKNIMVQMRDGTKIAVDIYRPDVENEKFPALLAWGMWGKENQEVVFWLRDSPQPYWFSPLWDGSLEAGDIPFLVSKGYAVVIPDPRGIGKSEGGPITGIDELHNPNDIYDLIEWIALQQWCNGNIGMIGPSSYSFSQLLIAQNPPPHLKAIFPIEAWYIGETSFTGMFDLTLMGIFHGGHIYDSTLPVAHFGAPRSMKLLPKDILEFRIKELLDHPDIKFNSKVRSILMYPRDPVFFDALLSWLHPTGVLGGLEKIEIPIYIGSTRGGGARVYYHAGFEAYDKAVSKFKKMIFLPPGLPARPWVEYSDEVIRWYDYWLKGIDTGIMDEPPIKIFVSGINKWKFENEFPPARAQWTKFYPLLGGGLSTEPPSSGIESFTQPPPYEDPTVYALFYESMPLSEDIEIIGWVSFYLEASIDKTDINWFIDLIDIYPDGKKQFVSEGWLRGSFRTLEEAKSKPWLPIYKIQDPIPITPGRVERYVIRMSPAAHVFKAGHKIGIIIRTQEDLFGRLQRAGVIFLPRMEKITVNVVLGSNTYILLPITNKGKIE